ncbi:MAG: nucleotidyl transferase AbiEii/AbiGii toxin family protein [Bacteroidales bacterium]|jgi:predicted nucleotidyltransferase component of viral defense system|nr:nucleotidyl transferase AbiEii/AbiGii toxin family protein [Bacteroidales bacterium]
MKTQSLQRQTVSDALWITLEQLMKMEALVPFRLVGGTALSLQLGHRISADIDLFTDSDYKSVDFNAIDEELQKQFPVVETQFIGNDSLGKTYYLGKDIDNVIKLDMFYTDTFIRPIVEIDSIRMASVEDIAAMKMETIGNNGRKKDFWDIHELMDIFSLKQMIDFFMERYPYSHTKENLLNKLIDFSYADDYFNPECLRGKYWDLIKIDIQKSVLNLGEDITN